MAYTVPPAVLSHSAIAARGRINRLPTRIDGIVPFRRAAYTLCLERRSSSARAPTLGYTLRKLSLCSCTVFIYTQYHHFMHIVKLILHIMHERDLIPI